MATFIELQNRVNALLDDTDLDDNVTVSDLINQGVYEIAGGMKSTLDNNVITPPLPELLYIGSVDTVTDAAFVAMPDNFHRDLYLISSSSGNEIDIAESLIDFTESYPLLNRAGNISEAIEHGRQLYYQGIPTSAETLTLYYYRKPVDMEDDTDEPDGIPEHLHMSLLVNFALWKAYEFLEDGIEGEIPNTLKFKSLFLESLNTLELTIPHFVRGLMLR